MGNNPKTQKKKQIQECDKIPANQDLLEKDDLYSFSLSGKKGILKQHTKFSQQNREIFKERENPVLKQSTQDIEHMENTNLNTRQIEKCIKFQLISETNEVSSIQNKTFVCGVNLIVKQPEQERERAPMDLICVIDDSGSMVGQKAKLVRKSLKYILKITNQNDRICFISFSENEKILTPLLLNNQENKIELKQAISNITESGIDAGLWMIKNRKEKNPITCLFLLSDGDDDDIEVDQRVNDLVQKYDIKDNFILNTYGYGKDHNSQKMRNIASTNRGNYYYIEDLRQVSEWFILSISGFMGSVGEEVRIKLKSINQNLTKVRITKVFGGDQLWVKQDFQKSQFKIYLPHVSIGDNKFFVFECEFDSENFKLSDEIRQLPFLQSSLSMKVLGEKYVIRKQESLKLLFLQPQWYTIDNEKEYYYKELMTTFYRAVGGEKIKEATRLIQHDQQFQQAKSILSEYQKYIRKNNKVVQSKGIKHLQEDLAEAIARCEKEEFDLAKFEKMELVHAQRQNSIHHLEDWNEEQDYVMNKFRNKDYIITEDSALEDNDSQSIKFDEESIKVHKPFDSDEDYDEDYYQKNRVKKQNLQNPPQDFSLKFQSNHSSEYTGQNWLQNNKKEKNGYNDDIDQCESIPIEFENNKKFQIQNTQLNLYNKKCCQYDDDDYYYYH